VAAQQRGYMDERRDQLLRQITDRLTVLGGVKAVSFSENGVFSGTESSTSFQIPGFVARTEDDTSAYYDEVGPRYVEAIGGRLVEGRDITDRDVPSSVPVALINQTMAQFYWPGRSAVGQTIRYEDVSVEGRGRARRHQGPRARLEAAPPFLPRLPPAGDRDAGLAPAHRPRDR
jgi:hypothetical protein